jgi:predicted CXXCH cytochrome family protein
MRVFILCIVFILIPSCFNKTPTYLNMNLDVNHVGVSTCASCHTDVYHSFSKTGMGQSIRVATRNNSNANFVDTLYDDKSQYYYYPHFIGDKVAVDEYSILNNDTIHHLTHIVSSIVGSGHHTNSHLIDNNGYLYQAPFTYYTQDSVLDFPPGFEDDNNTRFSRKMGLECIACHASYPDFVLGSENKFNSLPKAIDCERCHGPGELHVQAVASGHIVDTSTMVDYNIVNPKDLSIELQNELCARCHLQGNTVLKEGKSFYDFRPGMYLHEVMDVYLPRFENSQDSFIMASHVDRMKLSSCYINSNENISCITCHNPHVSVKNNSIDFNKKCVSCHTINICTETVKERALLDNNCISCHMPNSKTIDIPHVKITDHRIAIHNNQFKDTFDLSNEFLGLECINNTSPTYESLAQAYLQQYERFDAKEFYLDSAFVYLKNIDLNSKLGLRTYIHYLFLRKDFESIVNKVNQLGLEYFIEDNYVNKDYANKDAWTLYRIGDSFVALKLHNNALLFFQQAVYLAPFNLEFRNKYGVSLMNNNKISFAIDEFEFIINEDSDFVSAYTNLGYAHVLNNYYDQALFYYDYALRLNPGHERTLLNKGALLVLKQDYANAFIYINKVLILNSNNQEANKLLNEIQIYYN